MSVGLLVAACQPLPAPAPTAPSPADSPSPGTPLPPPVAAATERASVDSSGAQGDATSYAPTISGDGRYVAIASWASNLVVGDTNAGGDVFVRDRQIGTTERVSVASDGSEGSADSWEPVISADGRYVAFSSWASNLVPGDTNATFDVFVRDRQAETTARISVDSTGSQGNAGSYEPVISSDGRYVAFSSLADNLVTGDTNALIDVFVHDQQTGSTERISVDPAGSQATGDSFEPAISADGSAVAFSSSASDLVAGDTNGLTDVFVHNRQLGTTDRVSVDSAGSEGNAVSWQPVISGNGRHVAFASVADNMVAGDTNGSNDLFVHDRQTGTTERASINSAGSEGNSHSDEAALSVDGRYVAFASVASNLVPGDNGLEDVFVHDRQTGTTERVSVDSAGSPGNSHSWEPVISADGRYAAFSSVATNLVPGDTNASSDVFVRDRNG